MQRDVICIAHPMREWILYYVDHGLLYSSKGVARLSSGMFLLKKAVLIESKGETDRVEKFAGRLIRSVCLPLHVDRL